MFSQENVVTLDADLIVYPKYENVFAENQRWLDVHFLPLMSIHLGKINPEWHGKTVHLIQSFEPFDGCIGGWTSEYHNKFNIENWLCFRLTDDNKYKFLGEEGYF
ncbi:hypothetical protein [Acinetobacter sp. c3-l95]